MAQLKFLKDKLAIGMYAKDGEYVEFSENFECSGQVNILAINRSKLLNKSKKN